MTIYWIIGLEFQWPKLAFFVEKPPDAILLIEWFIASKNDIPANCRKIVSITVYDTYINHNLLAVSVILGCNLSVLGPGDSALNNCIPPIPKSGKIAIANTIIPIPPNQWVILLQNKIPSGKISTSLIIVAPVAV